MGCMRDSHSPFSFFVGINLGRALTKTFIHIPFVDTPYGFMISFGEASLCQQKEKQTKHKVILCKN